jgi:lipopolysaccharide export system permease protein
MRLLSRYLVRELLLSFLAIVFVLLLILMAGEIARLLSEALEGRLSPDLVLKLVLLKIPLALEMLIPLGVLLSVMLTFGRLYHEREMEVMSASGIGQGYFIRLLLGIAGILSVITLSISLFVSPWVLQQERQLLAEGQLKVQIKALAGGRFTPLSQSGGVFYAEKVSAKGELNEVFISLRPKDKPDVLITAPKGHFQLAGDRTMLVLEQGQFVEGGLGSGRLAVNRFEQMSVWLPDWQVRLSSVQVQAMPTEQLLTLLNDPKAGAQLEWRVFTGVSVVVMTLMGWRLARVAPRQGRYARMGYGLLFYLLFTQLAISLRAEVQRGDFSLFPGVFAMLLLPLLWWFPWRDWWQKVQSK